MSCGASSWLGRRLRARLAQLSMWRCLNLALGAIVCVLPAVTTLAAIAQTFVRFGAAVTASVALHPALVAVALAMFYVLCLARPRSLIRNRWLILGIGALTLVALTLSPLAFATPALALVAGSEAARLAWHHLRARRRPARADEAPTS